MAELLYLQSVSVSFDGFAALSDVTFSVAPKSIKVLIGPNGAGKSTLCDCVIGKVRVKSGQIFYKGEEITGLPDYKIVRKGICRKFQAPGVLDQLTVYDNLKVAVKKYKSWWQSLQSTLTPAEEARVQEVLELTHLKQRMDAPAVSLAHGEKQWLEIGMVVVEDPELLLLDEPTAGMTAQETAQTAELVRGLAAQRAVLVIDHDMAFVELLDAPVSVLHQGRLLKEGTLDEVRADPEVVSVYLGRSAEEALSA